MRTKLSEFLSVECKTSPVKLINYDIDKTDAKCKKLSVTNGSPEHNNVLKLWYTCALH